MFPPSSGYDFDIEALSGICGSISIACWVVVFSPQIIENFRRSSAEGLSMEFLVIWLLGDLFNILGAVLQGVLPTMIILAIYYTFADIVLILQVFYYRGFSLRDPKDPKPVNASNGHPTERSPLLANGHVDGTADEGLNAGALDQPERTRSHSSFRERFTSLDATHLSPATPMHPQTKDADDTEATKPSQPRSWLQAILFNGTAIILVVLAGIAGYYLSPSQPESDHGQTPADDQAQSLHFSLWGQIFGYICAILYLGSRVPQILLNYRRKSTEGLNALFFIFACVGNLTYVFSIFAFEPICSSHRHGHWHESNCQPGEGPRIYGRYILVNLSWLVGSAGTLFLDFAVFIQFFLYQHNRSDVLLTVEDVPRQTNGEGRGREPVE
jgi:solute carrier family 66 (lysosomal lysine-arginine transporter), member 1